MTHDSRTNPWFAVAIGLMGLIVGYGASAMISGPAAVDNNGGQVAVAPTNNDPTPPAPEPTTGDIPEVDVDNDHVRGPKNAKVTLVEYSDFECPFCKRHHPTIKKILETYPNDVNVVYRHYPLSFHPNAMPAAVASECAAELGGQDAFWKFHDAIFEGTSFDFTAIAKSIGLDEAKFTACTSSGKYDTKISDQQAGGDAGGVSGTPGNILVNNDTGDTQLISGAVPFESFKSAIDAMLNS